MFVSFYGVAGLALSIYDYFLWLWLILWCVLHWGLSLTTSCLTTNNKLYYDKLCQTLLREEEGQLRFFSSL
jgi:hypothetical protein